MELYLIRHGQTIWNKKGLLQGRTDIDLTEEGKNQAFELGLKYKNLKFDKVFSSPLKRAYETAELIIQNPKIKIIKDERLVELCFGEQEGKDFNEWKKESSPYNAFFNAPEKYNPPKNGETLQNIMERTKDFVKTEIESLYSKAERILIVAHGALNAALICYLENNSVSNYWGQGLQKNLEASIFNFNGKIWKKTN